MKRKLDAAKSALLRARHRAGVPIAEIAAEFGIAPSSAHAYVHAPTKGNRAQRRAVHVAKKAKRTATPTTGEPVSTEGLPSRDDLSRFLGEQLAGLRVDALTFRKAGDTSALAACNRNMVNVQALLARLAPPASSGIPDGMMLVPTGELEEIGARSIAQLHRLVEVAEAARAALPRCRACGQPTPPTDPTGEATHA